MISFDKEQIYLVTGASSGIGRGVCLLLNELGATVVGVARNQERLEETKNRCKYPENFHYEIKDLAEDIDGLPKYVKSLKDKYGKFSGFAYCAGIPFVAPLISLDYSRFNEVFGINYFAPIMMLKGFVDRRVNVGKGSSAVVISSIASYTCERGMAAYAGTKSALSASIRCIAKEVADKDIRVNCISPSDIKTELQIGASECRTLFPNYPLGQGEAEDVANMVAYLLSDKAKWITSQNYIVDCGCV